jgi:hypothetical protein
MVKRRDDKTTDPPDGRAAERLRLFVESRRTVSDEEAGKRRAEALLKTPREGRGAKQNRRKD